MTLSKCGLNTKIVLSWKRFIFSLLNRIPGGNSKMIPDKQIDEIERRLAESDSNFAHLICQRDSLRQFICWANSKPVDLKGRVVKIINTESI